MRDSMKAFSLALHVSLLYFPALFLQVSMMKTIRDSYIAYVGDELFGVNEI